MKLLDKSSLYYLLFLLPVLLVSGFVFYFIMTRQIDDNVDEMLLAQEKAIEGHFTFKENADYTNLYNDVDVKIRHLPFSLPAGNTFKDTLIYSNAEAELEPFRQLKACFTKNGEHFGITINRSKIESDALAGNIAILLAMMFGLLLPGILIINRFVSRRLWEPFNESLKKLGTLSFTNMEPGTFKPSAIREFNELNSALNKMTAKMYSDYNNQKNFTENASHELQTPLAVIKSKIDVLIQSQNMSAGDMQQIQDMETAVYKLTHLNKSLLLLSRIENRQFDDSAPVDLAVITDKLIENAADRLKLKNILLQKNYPLPHSVLQLNPLLAEILLSNLLQNAIRYNFEGGSIHITLTDKYFSIANTGPSLQGNETLLFDRFSKFNAAPESLGLGLAIVKQICDYYSFSIQYSNRNGQHYFHINF